MTATLNVFLQKYIALLTPLSLLLGVALHTLGENYLFAVPWLFAFMTFVGSLGMRARDVKVFTRYPKTILLSIAFLHILMPLFAYIVAITLFNDAMLTVGFVMAVAVPTGVTSVIWVTVCKGNLPLALAIILIDTLLAPIIMPTLLHIIVGAAIEVNTAGLLIDLLWMIVLPTLLGIVLNEVTKGRIQTQWSPKLAPFSKLALFAVVFINGSAISPYIKEPTRELAGIIATVLLVSVTGYTFAYVAGRLLYKKQPDVATTFMFIGGMRNISVGVVIATSYFPAKVAMPVVFGMLFQQILASTFSKLTKPPLQTTATA
ncbi:bile acid:sodium symporter family protein [Metalysinibacillus jejuensis]|uniref:bile acid:sodium symporter family protein n=1 Tax=Metalysinibacillus jejuensis TaxID=914327 RepID=UPI000D34B1DB|nr:bile acid:sodium symporter family protein [Metalysinibacillus jejuensis]